MFRRSIALIAFVALALGVGVALPATALAEPSAAPAQACSDPNPEQCPPTPGGGGNEEPPPPTCDNPAVCPPAPVPTWRSHVVQRLDAAIARVQASQAPPRAKQRAVQALTRVKNRLGGQSDCAPLCD